ncbi:flagellar hook-basal body complex protein [Bacillus sp. DTU_2020_1000418_1_SI_GHA_SEK_038]|uniref:flagellar hook protein FlgE n=1 Tax=Bacillus sp. DTU_2020_1000418_1_SI_GHA_SEK_038 TaxID=3077585 RepID=UPI0028F0505C|nr:flagellar hook-basal body complex protein [Bacillus sp. DTU_2020_1000418_1_SI_GHA_SEK_038]WNS77180.1 flagellar hook-basal body complex protein [Bacillus sp. DTU_2020_1000418_1_SI_GHA_SEK_038]
MLRSMYSGISGLKNFQTKLDVIGNNIANVNTAGFKKGRVTFKDTMNQMVTGASAATENRGGTNPIQVGLGSSLATIDTIHTGSSLQTTNRTLDLGIDGDGYFVVKDGQQTFYTRAGNFYLDDNGTLVNANGLKVQAYNNGVLEDIKVNVNATLPPLATDEIKLEGSLPDPTTVLAGATSEVQQMKVVDTNGVEHTLDYQYVENNGAWEIHLSNQMANPPVPAQVIALPYNAANTPPYTSNPTSFNLTTLGLPTGTVNISVDTLKQEGDSITAQANPNGNLSGKLESFSIGPTGEVSGVYSNGLIRNQGVLALAKFSNTSGLLKAGNNLFQETINSGTANINVPGSGRGSIAAGALEMSNVDLSEEFTEMITAQRGFQANTRIITTSDEILQELVNLKR